MLRFEKIRENGTSVIAFCQIDNFADRIFLLDFGESVDESLRPLLTGSSNNTIHDNSILIFDNAVKSETLVLLRASVLGRFKFKIDHARLEVRAMGVVFTVENYIFPLDVG